MTAKEGVTFATAESSLTSRFAVFHHVIDKIIDAQLDGRESDALVFSDCCFFRFRDAGFAFRFAADLQRQMISMRVPVRIGIGVGSFITIGFKLDARAKSTVHSTQFMGTAVVRAVEAEKGGKGMRIFLHSKVNGRVPNGMGSGTPPILPLPATSPDAYAELNYLHIEETFAAGLQDNTDDRTLAGAVTYLQARAPHDQHVQDHYTDTIAAINRMRVDLGREEIRF